MITIEEFLYLENISETQSRSLIQQYPNLKFDTPNDFREFFSREGISLRKEIISTKNEKTLLLERFKSFKNSNDYSNVKKYIEEQIKLKSKLKEIKNTGGTIEDISNTLSDINSDPIDPFFNFVIRKILTGSENGTLPSEELRDILDKLISDSSVEYYDEKSDIVRDTNGIIQSFKNIFKNKGRLRVPLLDERFLLSDFRYMIETKFVSLQDAVTAEDSVLKKASDAASIDQINGNNNETNKFLSDLSNLINQDGNSVTSLRAKIASLEETISVKNDIIQSQIDAEVRMDESLSALSQEGAILNQTVQTLEESNKNLQEQIDTKLNEIDKTIQSQMSSISSTLEDLTTTLVNDVNSTNDQQDAEITELRKKLSEIDQIKTELIQIKSKIK
jgi:hypothetical protein